MPPLLLVVGVEVPFAVAYAEDVGDSFASDVGCAAGVVGYFGHEGGVFFGGESDEHRFYAVLIRWHVCYRNVFRYRKSSSRLTPMTDDEANEMGLACALERYMSDYYAEVAPGGYVKGLGLAMMRHVASELKRYGWLK